MFDSICSDTRRILLLLAGMTFTVCPGANGETFTYTGLPGYPGATTTQFTGINSSGEMVGYAASGMAPDVRSYAFINVGGVFTDLSYPGTTNSAARAINDRGDVLGSYYTGLTVYYYLYSNGTFNEFFSSDQPYIFTGMNKNGQMVGNLNYGVGGSEAALYQNGVVTLLRYQNSYFNYFNGINDAGQIVGAWNLNTGPGYVKDGAFIYQNGNFTLLNYPGSLTTSPLAINNAGQIAGTYQLPNFYQTLSFFYSNGAYYDVTPPLNLFGPVTAMSNSGVIIGNIGAGSGQPYAGFIGIPSASAVPEPGSMGFALLGGSVMLIAMTRKRGALRP